MLAWGLSCLPLRESCLSHSTRHPHPLPGAQAELAAAREPDGEHQRQGWSPVPLQHRIHHASGPLVRPTLDLSDSNAKPRLIRGSRSPVTPSEQAAETTAPREATAGERRVH